MKLIERFKLTLKQPRHSTDSPESLQRQVLRLSIPAVGERLLMVLVGLMNTLLVGHLGASALAAVGLSTTITTIAWVFVSAVATGATALIAQAIGAKDRALAVRLLEQSMLVALILGIGGALLLLPFTRQSLVLMGAQPETVELGSVYLTYASASLPLISVLMVGNAALRGAGDTRTPMLVMAWVNVVNVALSLLLIRGWGPIPSLGVAGAGIASAASRGLGAIAIVALLIRGRATLRLRRLISRPDRAVLRRLLQVGLPAGGESLLMRLAFLAYTRAISSLGTAAYAAYMIASRIESLNTMPAFGFAIAATTLSGQALGAGDADRARSSVLKSVEIAAGFALFWALLSIAFPRFLLDLFTNDPEVIEQGIMPLRILALAQPIMSISFSLSGGLRGAGDTRSVMWVTGVGAWLVRVPITLLSITWLNLGLPGVQAAMALDWLTRMLLLGWRFRPAAWKKRMAALATEAKSVAPA